MKREYRTFWITRDSRAGVLRNKVHVWSAKPIRMTFDNAVEWVEPDTSNGESSIFLWSFDLAEAESRFRTIPETDIECIISTRMVEVG